MNNLSKDKRTLIIRLMVEGMSMASITRTVGVSKNTVAKLLVDAGNAFAAYQDGALRDLPCTRLEVDELWSFIYAKNKNVARAKSAPPEAGDVWTWLAICADTKLVPTWRIGDRTSATGLDFMDDLRQRLRHRVQLTTDGHRPYLVAVREAFGGDVDYAMLIKVYGSDGGEAAHRRYSPGQMNGSERIVVSGLAGPGQDQHQLRRTAESHRAHVTAALHPPDQWVLEEAGESRPRGSDLLHVVQLRPQAPDAEDDAGAGGGRHRPPVDDR